MSVKPQQKKSQSPLQRELEEDLRIARNVQEAMIPICLPAVEGIDIASLFLPGKDVGGDLFDVIHLSEDLLAFFMFDVSGYGVSSALIASMAKVSFLNHIRATNSPRNLIDRVNREMLEHLSTDYFITAFAAFLDLHSNKLTYCNAGYAYPLVFRRREQRLVPLTTSGVFIGIFTDGLYEEKAIYLYPGDWLVLFSNGLYELFDHTNELVGRNKLERMIARSAVETTPPRLLHAIHNKHRRFSRKTTLKDDICVVAVEVLTESRRNKIKENLGFSATDRVYLQFIAYFEEMDRAAAVILREMDEYGYPDEGIRRMKIALTELLANAICHGNRRDHSRKVTIGHTVDKQAVTVSIMDEGDGFDITRVPDPTLPENLEKDCGRGLYIVKNYVDRLFCNQKGNRVTIVKKHHVEET